jgi:hypothetical protein
LVVRDKVTHQAFFAVTFTLAKDGGSARKSGATKSAMARPTVPVAVVTLGPGWAERRETAAMMRAFDGAIFTEQTLERLVAHVATHHPNDEGV